MTDVDDLIAIALCGIAPWPKGADADLVVERATYHGVMGLLMARATHLADWPRDLHARLRAEAVAQTMWEIRHRTILTPLLAGLDAQGVRSILLKGTALAYGLYPAPGQRARGDTDLLVASGDLTATRSILTAQGFVCDMLMVEDTAALERQESWTLSATDGGYHEVDLHVDVFSSPALKPILTSAYARKIAVPVPALSSHSHALPLPLALLQACVHRAQHVVSPYAVGGQWHYGGDRLIWLMDIDLALRAMTPAQRDQFSQAANTAGVGPICAAALRSAVALLKTPCPEDLINALAQAPAGPAARYLSQSRSAGRVMSDLQAIPSFSGKLRHAALRLLPPASVLRARYPDLANAALPRLHLRRMSGLLRRRKAGPAMTRAQLIALVWPWRARMILVAALMLVESLAMLAVPWFGGQLAGRLVADTDGVASSPSAGLVVVVLALLTAVAGLRIGVGLLSGSMSVRFLAQLQSDLHDHLQSLPVPFHEAHQRGDLLALSTWEVSRLSNFLTGTLVGLPPLLLTALGSVALMFTIDPMLAVAVPILVPVFYLVLKIIGRHLRALAVAAQEAEAEALGLAEMHLELLPAIKSFTREEPASERYAAAIARARDIGLKEVRIGAIMSPVVQLVASASAVLLVVVIGHNSGDMSAGDLVAFLLYAALLTRPVSQLANVYGQIQNLKGTLARLGRVLNTSPEYENPDARPLDRAKGRVTFTAVDFAYPDRAATLRGIYLDIPAGQTLALTGANGAGKTTLAALMLRFLEPSAGEVQLDGISVDNLRLADLRRHIGVVPQRPLLFNGSVADNIGFGRIDATQAQIEDAAKLAQAHDFIATLPQGYNTQIGSHGVRLSGGQGQRIALARALVKDPPILILDEATSMFDTEGESDFVTGAATALRDRTVILITHRPATLALADRVVRLDDGQIVSDKPKTRHAT